jgi:O-antigen ligase
MGIAQGESISRPAELWLRMPWSRWALGVLVVGSLLVAFAMSFLPATLVSGDTIFIASVITAFVLLLCIVLGTAVARQVSARTVVFRMTLLVWWFVLICEVLFDHVGDTYHSYAGSFAPQVYGEGLVWLMAFAILAVLTLREPAFLRQLFTGDYKWVVLLTAVCLISVSYAPSKMYAAGWGFKLLLCVLALRLCGSLIQGPDDILTFLKVNLWAFLVLSVGPVIIAFSDPGTAFDGVGGRLNADPDLLSANAAYLLLLALIVNAFEKKKLYIFVAIVAVLVMFLALGKAGVLAGIFSAMVFLLFQKKVARSLGLLLGVAGLGLAILSATPLADHLRSYEGAATFTGRTVIWQAAMQRIRQKPILGHGYLASYFAWVGNDLSLTQQVTHLENSFMDLTYNEGLVGLGLMLLLHWSILRNVLAAIRDANARRVRSPGDVRATKIYILAVGMLAIYISLFLVSLVISSIGGRPMSPYMLFLAVFMISGELARLASALPESSRLGY